MKLQKSKTSKEKNKRQQQTTVNTRNRVGQKDTSELGTGSDPDKSEVVNVIPVQKKKQRVADYYLEPDSNYNSSDDEEEDYDSEDD